MELAWWLNVGVQIFLIISGYLYGQKHIQDPIRFYLKRFQKILVPYYIVLIIAFLSIVVFDNDAVDIMSFGKAIILNGTIAGGGHLWFVPTILMCYFLTPFFEQYFNIIGKSKRIFIAGTMLVSEIIAVFFLLFCRYYSATSIICYSLGYMIGVNEKYNIIRLKLINTIVFSLATLNFAQIIIDYVLDYEFSGMVKSVYSLFCQFNHVWLGLTIFLLSRTFFKHINHNSAQILVKMLDISDNYSYEWYLVHQFFILGPLSLMTITSIQGLNVVLIGLSIVCSSFIVKKIENNITKRLVI